MLALLRINPDYFTPPKPKAAPKAKKVCVCVCVRVHPPITSPINSRIHASFPDSRTPSPTPLSLLLPHFPNQSGTGSSGGQRNSLRARALSSRSRSTRASFTATMRAGWLSCTVASSGVSQGQSHRPGAHIGARYPRWCCRWAALLRHLFSHVYRVPVCVYFTHAHTP